FPTCTQHPLSSFILVSSQGISSNPARRNNIDSSSNSNTYGTNLGLFDGTSSHQRHSTDSCAAVNSHSTRSSQKHQPHRGILLQL
ncbi:unnamed protein product, partial [Closterium sp. NIES-53]